MNIFKKEILIVYVALFLLLSCNQDKKVLKYYLTNNSQKYWERHRYYIVPGIGMRLLKDEVCFYANGNMIDFMGFNKNNERTKYKFYNENVYIKWKLIKDSILIIKDEEYKILTLNDSIFEYCTLNNTQIDTIRATKSLNQNPSIKIEVLSSH